MTDVGTLLREGATVLRAAGIEGARSEARLLLEAAAGIPRARQLGFPETHVAAPPASCFRAFVRRRACREPMSHILGRREFWSLPFVVSRATLDPRPDSESVVEATLDRLHDRDRAWRILDLGTGTGCLLLAILSERKAATGLGVDRSEGAVEIAKVNARALGLSDRATFSVADWGEGLAPGWDAIVSNPPYIASAEIAALETEVAGFEPRMALDGGPDGLDSYRRLVPMAARLLRPGGVACFEFGADQDEAVIGIARATGLGLDSIGRDLAGRVRCAVFRRSPDQG